MARWRVSAVDEGLASGLASLLKVRPLTARILLGRGVHDAGLASRFLTPRLANLRPPDGIADLGRAGDRIVAAILRAETIGIFGDYDVDGVTTAAVLTLALRALGGKVVPRVANRFSGYGFGPPEATRFLDEGCTLVLTGDCGTTDHEALSLCRERGVDVVVIDHHQVPSGPTPAFALINPHRADDLFSFKGLASCGVAFYLAATLRSRLRAQGHPPALAFDPRDLLDLVALGTIADMVPLVDENRILVSAGLRLLSERRRPGVRALGEIAELDANVPLDATDVSFRLTPRLNAPGRLGEAQRALELLLAGNQDEARRRAAEVDEINRERQRIQEEVWTAAARAAEGEGDTPALVVAGEGWHPGVLGIVAAKLVERFGRPAVVIGFGGAMGGAIGRGSARTTGGFNLYAALDACRAHLVACGGHAAAAGLSIQPATLEAFRTAFLMEATRHFGRQPEREAPPVDAETHLRELDLAQLEELARLGPFGSANHEPIVALPGVTVQTSRVVGNGHLQLTVGKDGAFADAIAFGMGTDDPGPGTRLDLIAHPGIDTFRGMRRPRLRVRQILRTES